MQLKKLLRCSFGAIILQHLSLSNVDPTCLARDPQATDEAGGITHRQRAARARNRRGRQEEKEGACGVCRCVWTLNRLTSVQGSIDSLVATFATWMHA